MEEVYFSTAGDLNSVGSTRQNHQMLSKYPASFIGKDLEDAQEQRELTFSPRGLNKICQNVYSDSCGPLTRAASEQMPGFTHLYGLKEKKKTHLQKHRYFQA